MLCPSLWTEIRHRRKQGKLHGQQKESLGGREMGIPFLWINPLIVFEEQGLPIQVQPVSQSLGKLLYACLCAYSREAINEPTNHGN